MREFSHDYIGKDAPVDQSLNDGHLRLLELLLRVTASGVGEVDGMADLDVVGEGDVLDLDADVRIRMRPLDIQGTRRGTHSWVSHLPKSLTS